MYAYSCTTMYLLFIIHMSGGHNYVLPAMDVAKVGGSL